MQRHDREYMSPHQGASISNFAPVALEKSSERRPTQPLWSSHLLPLDAEGRIGQHVVEALARQTVVGECIAEEDVAQVLALDQQVGLADRVGLGVALLPEH